MDNSGLSSKVEIHLSADNLPKLDTFSNTDPFAVLYMGPPGQLVEVGRSETIDDTQAPRWTTQIIVDFFFEEVQELRVEIYDRDSKAEDLGRHDFAGSAALSMGKLMGHQGHIICPLTGGKAKKKSTVTLHAEEVSTCADLVQLQFVCTKLDNRDGIFGASDPFVKLSRSNPDHPGTWKAVWQSEVIMDNHNPTFKPATVSVQQLCNGDYDRQILLQVFDWDSDGTHDLIGETTSNMRDLLNKYGHGHGGATWLPLINERKKKHGWRATVGRYKNSGRIKLALCNLVRRASMLEYIRGGTEINLSVAVDYTGAVISRVAPPPPDPPLVSNGCCGLHRIERRSQVRLVLALY
jgi:hypothetical protein